jgi:hypothetical protein
MSNIDKRKKKVLEAKDIVVLECVKDAVELVGVSHNHFCLFLLGV